MEKNPLISVVMATYNRAKTIERAIDSVLKQTYTNWELIIVDDGSTDNTAEILDRYTDKRIRRFKNPVNKGVTTTKNVGLNNITGEWFTTLDSDDEMLPEALQTMIDIPLTFDKDVTAVTCNCIDSVTNQFSGQGLNKSMYVDFATSVTECKHEFWGLTKTSLMGTDRFNENLNGYESVLWYKIDERAKRYYIHKALRIYHTEGDDRICKTSYNFKKEVKHYSNIINEQHYLNTVKKFLPAQFNTLCQEGLIVTSASGNSTLAKKYLNFLGATGFKKIILAVLQYKWAAYLFIKAKTFKRWAKRQIYR